MTLDIKLLPEQLEGTEAIFSCWLVKLDEKVLEGQPIAELETDKVAIEICAEKTGTIQSLLIKQGDNVEPNQVLGQIAIDSTSATIDSPNTANEIEKQYGKDTVSQKEVPDGQGGSTDRLSPAVRRLIQENSVDISQVSGSGKRGRVTRDDVQKYLKTPLSIQKIVQQNSNDGSPIDHSIPVARPLKGQLVPHSTMRKSIASHMASSLLEISPHVTSVFEMDMSNIIEHRKWHKKEYLEYEIKLTFTAYFLAAMSQAVAKVPQVNAQFHQDALEIFDDINIGVGTSLGDKGLVVPVVQQVQNINLFQIAKALSLQTEKARSNQLTPADMKNGTLTISNHGVSGSLFATPIIINQPQVAILGIGKLEKRVVVEEVEGVDTMVIRPKCYVSLSIDHRALDAHQTNLFLTEFVSVIENWGE